MLEHGDLSRYDAIVVGPRAYETDAALPAANPRLLDYARRGGLLIVQYQQPGFTAAGFAPETLEITRSDRVTDETAKVAVLEPTHPIFKTPNAIVESDWDGWVQERGLYFAHSWAPAYKPLLSMADPGDTEQRGSLLVATIESKSPLCIHHGPGLFRMSSRPACQRHRALSLLCTLKSPLFSLIPARELG